MVAAFAHEFLELRHQLSIERASEIGVGFVMAFLSSLVIIRPFLGFVRRSGFGPFAWYRIAIGLLLLWLGGMWMWIYPFIGRRRVRRAKAAALRRQQQALKLN